MTSTARSTGVALVCGTLGAVAAWIGWQDFAPALGFPEVSPPGMLNRTLGVAPDAPLGWAVLLGGLAGLAVGYLLAVAKRLSRPGLFPGAIYGIPLWFLSGATLMPLMGLLSSDDPLPSADALTPMPPMTAGSRQPACAKRS